MNWVKWLAELDQFGIDFEEFGFDTSAHFHPTEGAPATLLQTVGQLSVVAISLVAFIWVSYAAIAKFRECQAGRADWGELMVLAGVASLLLVFLTFVLFRASLLTQAELI